MYLATASQRFSTRRSTVTDRFWALFVRAVGGLLVLAFLAPAWRLLADSEGIAAGAFVAAGPGFFVEGVLATVGVLLAGLLLAPIASQARKRTPPGSLGVLDRHLDTLSGVVAAVASLSFSLLVLGGAPFIVDGMSQMLQARLLVGGALELSSDLPIEFWYFQYLAPSSGGWTSQYPIGYPALMAIALAGGVPWLLGPVCHGLTAWLGVRWLRRLVPDDPAVRRWGALFLALSPFALALSGAYMNHGVTALLALVTLVAADRSGGDGGFLRRLGPGIGAGLVAGLAVGVIATMRPLTGVITAIAAGVVWIAGREGGVRPHRRFPVGALLGGLPPLMGLLWVNQRLFGAPLTFGYTAAQGPNHGLGFHVDPWGAHYGWTDAIGYAGTELRALGAEVFGVPVPALFLLGMVLLWVKVPARRIGPLLVWALLPALAGLLYWHHDLAMGPRLLSDAAPAWSILLAWGLTLGVRSLGGGGDRRTHYVHGVILATTLAGVGLGALRLSGYSAPTGRIASAAAVPADALVFVHDTWESRLSARLAALGARDDQIRIVRASRSTCDLQLTLDALGGAGLDGPWVERLVAEPPEPGLSQRVMPSGSRIATRPGEELTGVCQQEAVSDFNGVAGLPQRLWLGDLPAHERGRPMYVRDLGPERNRELLERWPERRAYLLVPTAPARLPDLLPYEEGMSRLWSAGAGSAGG